MEDRKSIRRVPRLIVLTDDDVESSSTVVQRRVQSCGAILAADRSRVWPVHCKQINLQCAMKPTQPLPSCGRERLHNFLWLCEVITYSAMTEAMLCLHAAPLAEYSLALLE